MSHIFAEAATFWRQMKAEYDDMLEREYRRAETATNGYLVNREGRRRHIDGRTLFSGPEVRARKYASDELLEHWNNHPRPSLQHFEKQWAAERMILL